MSPAGGERRASEFGIAAEDPSRQRHGHAMSRGACRRLRRSRPCASALSLAGDRLSNTLTQNRRKPPVMMPGNPRVRWPRLPSESLQSRQQRDCAGAAGHREAVARPPGNWQARNGAALGGGRGPSGAHSAEHPSREGEAQIDRGGGGRAGGASLRSLRGGFQVVHMCPEPGCGGPRTGIGSVAGLPSRAPQTREPGRAQAGPERRPVRVAAVQATAAALSWRKGPRRGIAVALAVRGRDVRRQRVTGVALPVLPGGHGSHGKQRMVKCF